MTGEHAIWPKSLEFQLNLGQAGDFWAIRGYEVTGCELVPGKIALTAEGQEVHFRNVRLVVLP